MEEPGGLPIFARMGDWARGIGEAYHGDDLNAKVKAVRGQIARVGQGVFLPQLAEEALSRCKAVMIEDEMGYEMTSASASRPIDTRPNNKLGTFKEAMQSSA